MIIPTFWNYTINDLNNVTSTENQSINQLILTECNTTYNTTVLNFTINDEATQDILNGSLGSNLEVDFLMWKDSISVNRTYNMSFINKTNVNICIYPAWSSFNTDATITYSATDYVPRYYYFYNATISNSTQNIPLFDLLTADAQKFLITYKDSNFLPVENAFIYIQRKYVSQATSKTVEMAKTDAYGQTTGQFNLNGVTYSLIVMKDGEVLSTFGNIAIVCQDLVIGDCRLNLNALSSGTSFSDWDKLGNITYNIDFNETSRTVTTTFASTDGTAKTVIINTTKFDRFGNETVCSDELTSSSGTLTCTIPVIFGNVSVISKLYSDGNLVTTRLFSISPYSTNYFGTDGVVMVIILLLTLPLMFITSTIGVIIGAISGLIMAALLMIFKSGSGIGTTSAIVWAIIAGAIIIWKIASKESGET